jgi:hypothetical protein
MYRELFCEFHFPQIFCFIGNNSAEDNYDYDSLNPFREIERIGRQTASKSSSSAEDHNHNHHHPTIQLVQAQCMKSSGLSVTVEFDAPFDGVIYSKGHFSDPKCRYMNESIARELDGLP